MTPVEQDEDERERAPRRRRRRPRFLVWTGRVLFVVISVCVLTPLVVGWRVWYEARQDHRPKSDAIIVLGAAQYDGKPSPYLEFRLRHAFELYEDGVAPRIVTVGGKQTGDRVTEAAAGRDFLIGLGVPGDDVVAVERGRDTLQSMVAVGEEYKENGWKSGVVVTDPWHSLRSKKMASENGIKAASSPTRSGPSVLSRDTQLHSIVRETGGYLYYVLLGRSRAKT
ncbi:YdcF family protein [Actinocorallia sp. A-T 12471]|uniref:YdcF family protein n=1 Tax=Actinocorallia sp. A-T 12471 TaxID=3089813 RepID=UPI0029D19BE6|nr:YdcF family protein [Actinocorallia sp. A-T 12471]MDX6744682.1 YdcF family protein [Actinocorallia sp. A-T 12471]